MLRRVLAGIAMVVVGVGLQAAMLRAQAASVSRKAAPSFRLEDPNGAPVRLSDYQGRVVLLNFWATWCHGCKLEIPWFMEFQSKYRERGLTVIGVSMDDDGWKSVKPYLAEHKLNYPVVIGNQDLGKQYGLDGMPMTLLIDGEGKIAATYSGMVDRTKCESEIRNLLGERTGNAVK
jgi:peroxiredoxin